MPGYDQEWGNIRMTTKRRVMRSFEEVSCEGEMRESEERAEQRDIEREI